MLKKHLLNYDEFLNKLGIHLGTTINIYNRAYKEFSKIEKDAAKLIGGKARIKPKEIEKPNNIKE